MITFDQNNKLFHITTPNTSYAFGIFNEQALVHLYWGKRIQDLSLFPTILDVSGRALSAIDYGFDGHGCTDVMTMEYPTYGSADLRNPAFHAKYADGSSITKLLYVSHKIYAGKPKLEGLPATYVDDDCEATTLELTMRDDRTGTSVVLQYTSFENLDAITRSVKVINNGSDTMTLSRVLSASVDMIGKDFEFLNLEGAWARERNVQRTPLFRGTQMVDSKRGASSAQHNPFFALVSKNATEDTGEIFGFNFVYSGNFVGGVQVDAYDTTRAFMGINPFDFSWVLKPGESFQSPEVVLVYSDEGLGKMSRTYHKLYRTRLCRGKFRDIERYVLVNNWEGTYFNFTEEKLLAIAEKAVEANLDLLVLDDGWFGKRDDDKTSLGDWTVYDKKLPNGLNGLADKLEAMGLKFGLWFEPEMASPDSDLYRAHPDWCIHVPGVKSSLGRNQLILDLSRDDVCDYLIGALSDVLSSAKIAYVKWDMNRNMTEIGSALLPAEQQSEVPHRYILGLYRILETLVTRFPNVLFESCSSGGARYDGGMLYYMPQNWVSDDSDAGERMSIQYGTSIVYPFSSMGCHVSASPNHQIERVTSFTTRGDVATMGQFGYELDMSKMSDEELELTRKQVARYRALGEVYHKGDLYRLRSPFESDNSVFQFISEDGDTVVLNWFSTHCTPNPPLEKLKFKGLDPNARYKEEKNGDYKETTDLTFGGDLLMNMGLTFANWRDYKSIVRVFKKVK